VTNTNILWLTCQYNYVIFSRCPEVHEQLIQQQRTEKLEQLPPQNEQIQQVEHLQSVVHGFESQLRSMKDLTESFNHLVCLSGCWLVSFVGWKTKLTFRNSFCQPLQGHSNNVEY